MNELAMKLKQFTRFRRSASWRSRRLAAIISVALMLVCALPASALQARLTPTSPKLGDTISVTVSESTPGVQPSVTFQDKRYQAFPMGNGIFRALLPTTPLDTPGRKTVVVDDGQEQRNLAVQLGKRSFPTQRIWLPPGKDGIEGSDYEFDRMDALKATVTPEKLWNGPFKRPAAGGVTSVFGVRRYYNGVFANDYYHRGVDYGGGTGAPVYAPAAGRIALVGREREGFEIHGNSVGIDHGQGVISIMIHLSRIDVQEGQMVKPGQKIGAIGATGAVTGPHLHWGLYVNNKAVDPVAWRFDGVK